MADLLAATRLLQLASPSLPIGGFAYSRALETAVEQAGVVNRASAERWILGLFEHVFAALDAPLLLRMHAAVEAGDTDALRRWAAFADASRETAELRAQGRHTGGSLSRWLRELQLDTMDDPILARSDLAALAIAGVRLGLDAETTLTAAAWHFVEGQVAAAIKLVPLGQSDGQRILLAAGARIPDVIARAEHD